MKKILGIILALSLSTWAIDAFYRHHQKSTTTSLEASLVNREIGIDASSRNSVIAKKADGSLIHLISKEMDSVTLTGVVGITGALTASSTVKLSSYTSGRVPYFSTGGLIVDASTLTYNGTTLAVNNIGVTSALTAATVVASGNITADSLVSSKFYEEGSFTATYSGGTTAPTGTARWIRVGKQITLMLPSLSATSNSTEFTYTGMPAGLAPGTNQSCPLPASAATDNSAAINTARVYIDQSGPTIRFQVAGLSSGWTSSGTKGISGGTSAEVVVTYTKY